MELLKEHQLSIMLMLSGICGIITLFSIFTPLSAKRKQALTFMDFSAMLLLLSDRCAYIYRGDTSPLGFWMVRISNFLVFFLTLVIIYTFNLYLIDLYTNEAKLETIPKRLQYSKILVIIGEILVIISQFTGFYYTFDATNHYQRAGGFIICYILPLTILILQLSVIVQHYGRLNKLIRISLLLFTLIPLTASIIQIFTYGVSLTNISLVGQGVMLYLFALLDMNQMIKVAHERELELLKNEQKQMRLMIGQTASALAWAIDAKDKYTHGHSRRVAEYSQSIAELAGKPDRECVEIYLIALLHDVGKIGIPDGIISKDGRLTDEEFAVIKTHPVIGGQILSRIKQFPDLSIGAKYHHERYDGRDYPEGLKGEEIPEIARIIAVADAYDAMSSKRSYRDCLPQEVVRNEIVKGMGTQFDPKFAGIMLELIDKDKNYHMRQTDDD